jgi:hypothetical protein
MSSKTRGGWLILIGVTSSVLALAQQDYPTISYQDADKHIDEIVWVEGKILLTEKAREGEYLLFNANEKYVRILVPSADLKNFDGSLRHMYTGERVKAIGKVMRYGPRLIVGVNEPKRIRIQDDETN